MFRDIFLWFLTSHLRAAQGQRGVFHSNEAIKQAVQAGLGLGIVSIQTGELELEMKQRVTLDVDYFPIMRHWFVVHRENKRLSMVALA